MKKALNAVKIEYKLFLFSCLHKLLFVDFVKMHMKSLKKSQLLFAVCLFSFARIADADDVKLFRLQSDLLVFPSLSLIEESRLRSLLELVDERLLLLVLLLLIPLLLLLLLLELFLFELTLLNIMEFSSKVFNLDRLFILFFLFFLFFLCSERVNNMASVLEPREYFFSSIFSILSLLGFDTFINGVVNNNATTTVNSHTEK